MTGTMPLWFVHDPESQTTTIDVQVAAKDGAGLLTIHYNESKNDIEITLSPDRNATLKGD